jgi:hypothetical protein
LCLLSRHEKYERRAHEMLSHDAYLDTAAP